MKSLPLLSLSALMWMVVAFTGCTTIDVSTDYALEQDFSQYRVYQWHPDGITQNAALDAMGGDIFAARIKRVTEETLAARGMRQGPDPDFYVNYSVITEERVSINTYNTYGGYGPGWGYYGYGYGAWGVGGSQTLVNYYTEGAIVIDVVDAASNQLVWRGTADSVLDPSLSPIKKEQELRQALSKMFENFPPLAVPQ